MLDLHDSELSTVERRSGGRDLDGLIAGRRVHTLNSWSFLIKRRNILLMRELKLLTVITALVLYAACSTSTPTNTSSGANRTVVNGTTQTAANTVASPAAGSEIASGADLYKTSCSKCHKEDG